MGECTRIGGDDRFMNHFMESDRPSGRVAVCRAGAKGATHLISAREIAGTSPAAPDALRLQRRSTSAKPNGSRLWPTELTWMRKVA